MLLPGYVGLTDPIAEIRELAVGALQDALAGADSVVVLADHRPPVVGGWTGEPLGVRVGRRLLALAGWSGPVRAGTGHDGTPATLLLVVGDGSACRSAKAPGSFDERAFGIDTTILAALASADTATLLGLDVGLCDELLVSGAAALRLAASMMTERTDLVGRVLWSGDPWGVQYWVARWSVRPAQ